LSPADRERAFSRGAQYLRDAGVFVRHYGEEREPTGLAAEPGAGDPARERMADAGREGLAERADLLETVVADLYGENRLVAEGHLPASLMAGNPEWLRPLVGVKPASGISCIFSPFEVGRGPMAAGGFWATGPRRPRAPATRWKTELPRYANLSGFYNQAECGTAGRLLPCFRDGLNAIAAKTAAGWDPDARPAQRHLFRTCLYRPLPRHDAARRAMTLWSTMGG
jgi:hypothetical protein